MTQDSLPPEEVPQDLQADKSADVYGDMGNIPEEEYYGTTRRQSFDSSLVTLPIRYVLLGISLVALLLVILAIVSTILIMRGC